MFHYLMSFRLFGNWYFISILLRENFVLLSYSRSVNEKKNEKDFQCNLHKLKMFHELFIYILKNCVCVVCVYSLQNMTREIGIWFIEILLSQFSTS